MATCVGAPQIKKVSPAMTKTEYAAYLSSEHWKEVRNRILNEVSHCERCGIPRYLANICYDQDLHVHHKSYRNLGNEDYSDLEVLCRRCHELETFKQTQIKECKSVECSFCSRHHWDIYHPDRLCPACSGIFDGPNITTCNLLTPIPSGARLLWQYLLWVIACGGREVSINEVLGELAKIEQAQRDRKLRDAPEGVPF